ncbi:MAG: heme NO-binding domain-containing protein [bacterium]
MHGIIVNQLRQFVVSNHGREVWNRLRADAGVEMADVPAIERAYDDADVMALVQAAAAASGGDVQALLEQFGEFLAPALLRIYAPVLRPEWRTLDVIEHTEERIHRVVRRQDPEAAPPYLTATRASPDAVVVDYVSPRRLCSVARGIMHGLASHFGERLDIQQPTCMLRGDPACLLVARLVG